MFDILQVPRLGREEDAADQFSTYLMLRFEKADARRLILGSAYQYKGDLAAPTVTMARQKFADEHGTPVQRFYNLLCMAYGADPKLFADVVTKDFLPKDRAEGLRGRIQSGGFCHGEVDRAVDRLEARAKAAPEMAAAGDDEAETVAVVATFEPPCIGGNRSGRPGVIPGDRRRL